MLETIIKRVHKSSKNNFSNLHYNSHHYYVR